MSEIKRRREKATFNWKLLLIDWLFYAFTCVVLMVLYPYTIDRLLWTDSAAHAVIGCVCVFGVRFLMSVYRSIWRYAGTKDYLGMIFSDLAACLIFVTLIRFLPRRMSAMRAIAIILSNLLGAIIMRMVYQYLYQNRNGGHRAVNAVLEALRVLTGTRINRTSALQDVKRVRVAVIGAGSVGTMLAQELLSSSSAAYVPVCFVDSSEEKIGRSVLGIDVVGSGEDLPAKLRYYRVQEVVMALPDVAPEHKQELYGRYKGLGYKIKIYDYPVMQSAENAQRELREFDIEDLLYRKTVGLISEDTAAWYRGRSVLITGGGGSIGSELARQIARLGPSHLTVLDVYENGAYDLQQELRSRYGARLDLSVEIASVCDRGQLERIFERHRPDIVLHAAAHKHVPLMEHNCCEAVRNNVFGTLNTVETCERFGVKRFIMISTDKAVNPTNVMGATKRMCEMIVQSRSGSVTSFSATRFGNVLGSNGSVIPLFRRQIAAGGPVTLTDKRVVRYFMTIPEASQLVMTSGAMAKNGELYVLDMGRPVRISDLAENMIRLSGRRPYQDIDIVETGLRPGEKLYEELLIRGEDLDRTSNDKIFVERDRPLSMREIEEKLRLLRRALETENDDAVREALRQAVPTFRDPEEVNAAAARAEEMKEAARD